MTPDARIARAVEQAHADALTSISAPADGAPRAIHVAIGDPQAPLATFLRVLECNGLLGDEGRLRAEVALISMGDHFDWGTPEQREQATAEGTALLSWLAAHPADQAAIVLGNHDLARVGELAGLGDEAYAVMRSAADAVYKRGQVDEEAQRALLKRWPRLPTAELAARDFSSFSKAQSALVEALLRGRRARLGFEHRGLLLVHAGLTIDELALLGNPRTAAETALALDAFLDRGLDSWRDGPLELAPLHLPGNAARGEGRGILYHRPADPSLGQPDLFAGPPRRRFDPRRLPAFTQAIGHIRDGKCRKLLPGWCVSEPEADGPMRSLALDGALPRYGRGAWPDARVLFLDGGMSHAAPEHYQLLDLDSRAPYCAR